MSSPTQEEEEGNISNASLLQDQDVSGNGILMTCACGEREKEKLHQKVTPLSLQADAYESANHPSWTKRGWILPLPRNSLGISTTPMQRTVCTIITDAVDHRILAEKDSKVKKIVIMGNIGAGKTTFFKKLRDRLYHVKEMDTASYGFYDEDDYMSQDKEIVRKADALGTITRIIITDRDPFQTIPFFVVWYCKDSIEHQVMVRSMEGMVAQAQRIPTAAIIYVRIPVEECVKRNLKRGMAAELAYLTELDLMHEIFYQHALSNLGERILVKVVTGSESDLLEMERLVRQL